MEILNYRLKERHAECIAKAKRVDAIVKKASRRLSGVSFFKKALRLGKVLQIMRRIDELGIGWLRLLVPMHIL